MIKSNNQYNFEINYKNIRIGNNLAFFPLFLLSDKLKKGFKDEITLNEGLKLVINEYKPKSNLVINFQISNAPIEFAYCLSGRMSIEFHSDNGNIDFLEVSSGASALFYLPNTYGILKVYWNEPLKIISLHCSTEYISKFLDDSELNFNESIDLNSESLRPFLEITKSNAGIRSAASQIIESNLTGKLKNIFFESKSNELIVLILEQIRSNYSDEKTEIITKNDLLKVAEVEQVLINNLAEVPSLLELSDIASMTHTKLNRIFKRVYGNTVFGYLRELRLRKAKELLEIGDMTIADIAYDTGWSSPSHLSREFKDEFGLTPKSFSRKKNK
jgi:AraC-like DNA-binding protein